MKDLDLATQLVSGPLQLRFGSAELLHPVLQHTDLFHFALSTFLRRHSIALALALQPVRVGSADVRDTRDDLRLILRDRDAERNDRLLLLEAQSAGADRRRDRAAEAAEGCRTDGVLSVMNWLAW